MPVECGRQCWLCDLPIRYDNYKGCTHNCSYCFVRRGKNDILKVEKDGGIDSLKNFVEGNRNAMTRWCDWDIPIHWGGVSDPFQPIEKKHRTTLQALKYLRETQYPFVVSTKGRLVADDEYLDIIKDCRCVVQISMVCGEYDKLEPGAPSFEERVEMARKVAATGIRVNARVQPYMTQVKDSVMDSIEKFADAGVYGVIVEGMKFQRKIKGLEKVGADFVYPMSILKSHFSQIREKTHELGMKFYSGENRLRSMGDSLTCCGIDELDGFRGNSYNLNHILNGDKPILTESMRKPETAEPFKTVDQTTIGHRKYKAMSFEEAMVDFYKQKTSFVNDVFGK